MLNDRDIREENLQILVPRWQALAGQSANTDAMRLGVTPVYVGYLRPLDDLQIRRVCDCSSPLFCLSQPDDIMQKLLLAGPESDVTPFDKIDHLIEKENLVVLLNRWGSVKISAVHAQCTFGLSEATVKALQGATINDIQSASRKGVRLVSFAARPKYFFHSGRNMMLQRPMRTALAKCSSTKAFL